MTAAKRTLPAEWAEQSAVLLTWPHGRGDWAGSLHLVEPVFVEITRTISHHESVIIVCWDEAQISHVKALLRDAGAEITRVCFYPAPSNDVWARDHGPITVFDDGQPRLVDFIFNGWGGKHPAELDDRLNDTLRRGGAFGDVPMERAELVLEGGAIDTDGHGTLLTTTRCLLAPGRNPELDRAAIEVQLRGRLGVHRVLWLEHGFIPGDDTDGHIDTLARFCDPATIAHVTVDGPGEPHADELRSLETELRALRRLDGSPYRLVPLPSPAPRYDRAGPRLPLTYANFLIINGAVLVPVYDDEADARACSQLQDCFPDRAIVPVDCLPLVTQNGSLHCTAMQLPAGIGPGAPAGTC